MIAKILTNSTTKSRIHRLIEIFTTFGLPCSIITDNASNFTSSEIEEFFTTFGILHRKSSVLNSRGNAYAESSIKRLQDKLRIYQPTLEELPTFLNVITFILNTEKRDTSKYSAFESLYHREGSWTRQIPELSISKKKTMSNHIKAMFENASKIQQEILSEIYEKRKNLLSKMQKIRFHVSKNCKRLVS